MKFQRDWDSTCPCVYDQWERDGTRWLIQDLEPEDDEEAVAIMLQHFLVDEPVSIASKVNDDEVSVGHLADFWRRCLMQRMSLGCYAVRDGRRTLAALNCCIVHDRDDADDIPKYAGYRTDSAGNICYTDREPWRTVVDCMKYMEKEARPFDVLGVDRLVTAMGLVVRREFRGSKLGERILAAREPLATSKGIKGTSTVFTGIASQKSAERAGFKTVLARSFSELQQLGFSLPKDDTKIIKLMVNKYV